MNDKTFEILEPIYDSRKSFYNKAKTTTIYGDISLMSYGTRVASLDGNEVKLHPKWDSSATTLRHVKEFLKQAGFKAETKAQIAKDYLVD